MTTTQGHKLDVVVTVRLEPRDFARILLHFKEQGHVFPDRAALLREVYQLFILDHKVRELTTEEAREILAEEYYIRTPKQKVIDKMRGEMDNRKFDQARKLIESQGVDIDDIFQNLPTEEGESNGDTETKSNGDTETME